MDEEWIEHAFGAALGNKTPDWDHASPNNSISHFSIDALY